MAAITPRQRWIDAVWASDLAPTHRLVAHAFARYAARGLDDVWLAQSHLCTITGLTKPTAIKATRALIDLGWLVIVEPARQRRSARYALTTPRGQATSPLEPSQGESQLTTSDSPRGKPGTPSDKAGDLQGATDLPQTTSMNPKTEPQLLHPALVAAFHAEGIDDEAFMREVIHKADEDEGTRSSGAGRLLNQPGYLSRRIRLQTHISTVAGSPEAFEASMLQCFQCARSKHECDDQGALQTSLGEPVCIGYHRRNESLLGRDTA